MQRLVLDVMNELEACYPAAQAASWDAVGLSLGDPDRPVTGVVVALDLDAGALAAAQEHQAEMIVVHHPPLFQPVRSLTTEQMPQRLVLQCLEAGIAVFSAHTNLDVATDGVGFCLADSLFPQRESQVLLPSPERPGSGFGRFLEIAEKTAGELLRQASLTLAAPWSRLFGAPERRIGRLALWPGAYDDEALPALQKKAVDLLLVGEVKHHQTVWLPEAGIDLIVVGHDASEAVVLRPLARRLSRRFPDLRFVVHTPF